MLFTKKLWDLQIQAKIKIHFWKLVNDFLPHYTNLAKRRLPIDVTCPLCKQSPETLEHLVWICPDLQQAWQHLGLSHAPPSDTLEYRNWLVKAFISVDIQIRQLMVSLIGHYIVELKIPYKI